jgi:integrase/recombinase XerD
MAFAMRRARKYLPYSAWPENDRARWEAAFKMGVDRFDDCGLAAHLAERTRSQLKYAYGKFLAFIAAHDCSLLACTPAARLDRKIIEAYVRWQPASCGSVTVTNYLHHLWMALRYICPGEDWSWLSTITKRIAYQAKPKPERCHLVTSETLYALGIELMECGIARVTAAKNVSPRNAEGYRDGLIIALLALIPLRRRTLKALRIGKHLVRSGNLWALDIPAEDTKNRRPLEYPISRVLSGYIDLYLNQFRCPIRGAAWHDYLWASNRGRTMDDPAIYEAVRRRTRASLGFPVNLHRFRRAAATLWSSRDPANVRGSKDLLGHATFNTTDKYYIMAQSRIAGRTLARAIEGKRKGA